ncbi:MAG: hypothetical protein WBO24_03600 [Nitrospirales bacterium]
MKKYWFGLFAVISFVVGLVLSQASLSLAQVDEARGTNFGNLRKLMPEIEENLKNMNLKVAKDRVDEFKNNMDYVNNFIDKSGENLDSVDKEWLSQTNKDKVKQLGGQVQIEAGFLKGDIGERNYNDSYNKFKARWEEWIKEFDAYWGMYSARVTQMEQRAKKYRESCKNCPS